MRIMAIDYGDARTGVAISDPTGLLAGYTTVIQSRKEGVVAEELARLAKEHSVDELVMGFPRNMDGTEGPGRSSTGPLPPGWRRSAASSRCSGMSAAPRWRPTASSTPRASG